MNNYEKLLYKLNRQKHQLKVLQDKCHKYKIVLDKIKEYIQSLGTQDGMIKDYMIDKNIKETILELLEEIE